LVPLIVASPVAAQPVMLAAPPKPAAASGRVESVWAPLLGNGPASPVQSPVSWVMLAAARRDLVAGCGVDRAASRPGGDGILGSRPRSHKYPAGDQQCGAQRAELDHRGGDWDGQGQ
jgi:hypothetical protein